MEFRISSQIQFPLFLLAALAVSAIPFLSYPLTWYETFFHETSHGLAAVLTGGVVTGIELNFDGSGLLWSAGGIRGITSFAGYAGVFLWGALIYNAAAESNHKASIAIATVLAGLVAGVYIFWSGYTDISTTVIMAILFGTFVLMAKKANGPFVRNALRFIGAYVIVSGIRSPTYILAAGGAHNDATTLRDLVWLPEWFWVGIWCLIGCGTILLVWKREVDRSRIEDLSQRNSAAIL